MSNVFICLTSCYADQTSIRFNPNLITSYCSNGAFTQITTSSGEVFTVQQTPEEIDTLLTESYFMVKKI